MSIIVYVADSYTKKSYTPYYRPELMKPQPLMLIPITLQCSISTMFTYIF